MKDIPTYSQWSNEQSKKNPFWFAVNEQTRVMLYKKEYPSTQTTETVESLFGTLFKNPKQ